MSGSMRYDNPTVCEHLASQYVAGVMTPLVRARMDALMTQSPALKKTTVNWAARFSVLQDQLPDAPVSSQLWGKIDKKITLIEKQKQSINRPPQQVKTWWHNMLFWQLTSVAGMASSFVLAMLFVFLPAPAPVEIIVEVPAQSSNVGSLVSSPPSYMAAMSRQVSANETENTIRFVINAYKKTASAPSRLFVQWSERQPRDMQSALHLWAEDIDTGEISYIGVEPTKGEFWSLTKVTWAAIANSRRLFMTADASPPSVGSVLFSGPCIQLGEWQQEA